MSKLFLKTKRESMMFLLDFILRKFPDCRLKKFGLDIVDKTIIFAPIKLVGACRKTWKDVRRLVAVVCFTVWSPRFLCPIFIQNCRGIYGSDPPARRGIWLKYAPCKNIARGILCIFCMFCIFYIFCIFCILCIFCIFCIVSFEK